jgi:enoyl-CoA hydratase/carnithine racemase
MDFKTLQVSINAGICHVQLHLPKRLNAMSGQFFADIKQCFQSIAVNSDIRVVFLSGGPSKIFTAGLDLTDTAFLQQEMEVSRKALMIRRHLMGTEVNLLTVWIVD